MTYDDGPFAPESFPAAMFPFRPAPRPDRRARRTTRPVDTAAAAVEPLEGRTLLTFIVVDTLDDAVVRDGLISLREAVTAANLNRAFSDAPAGEAGPIDRIRVSTALRQNGQMPPLALNSGLTLTDGVVLLGTGVTLDGSAFAGPVLNVQLPANEQVVLDSTIIRNGTSTNAAGAGVRFTGAGGGVADRSATLGVRLGRVLNNVATGAGGGGIYQSGGRMNVRGSLIASNAADNGGAVLVDDGGVAVFDGTAFRRNEAAVNGGAVALTAGGTLTLDGVEMSANVAGVADDFGAGGGVAVLGDAYVSVIDGTFTANRAANEGGAIVNAFGRLAVRDATFDRNVALDRPGNFLAGAGISSNGVTLVERTTFTANAAQGTVGGGGAAFVNGGRFVMRDSVVSGNSAAGAGGGVAVGAGNSPRVTLTRTDFTGNSAGSAASPAGLGDGGAVFAAGDAGIFLSIGGGLYRDNTANGEGGAVALGTGGLTEIGGVRFVTNSASAGGAVFTAGATLDLDDTLFNQNRALGTPADGGGLYVQAGSTRVTDSTFINHNAGRHGGGIFTSGNLTLTASVVQNNAANTAGTGGRGGGVYVLQAGGGTLSRPGTSITGNTPDNVFVA